MAIIPFGFGYWLANRKKIKAEKKVCIQKQNEQIEELRKRFSDKEAEQINENFNKKRVFRDGQKILKA